MEDLEALNEVRQQLIYYKEYAKEKLPTKAEQIDAEGEEELNLIETVLKDYATRKTLIETIDSGEMVFEERIVWEEKQKKLKAFEIIKEKQVNIAALLELDSLQQYNDYCDMVGGCKKLTPEEYDLLKEVLKHE